MNIWIAAVAAALTGWLSASARQSPLVRRIFAAGSVALGVALLVFNYNDAERAKLGEAPLLGSDLTELDRRQVRCTQPSWDCASATEENGQQRVPFSCGETPEVMAAFREPLECGELPTELAGYLVDMNEAGGEAEAWVLQVGAEPREFPGTIAWIGLGFVVLGFAFPAIARRSARRAEA